MAVLDGDEGALDQLGAEAGVEQRQRRRAAQGDDRLPHPTARRLRASEDLDGALEDHGGTHQKVTLVRRQRAPLPDASCLGERLQAQGSTEAHRGHADRPGEAAQVPRGYALADALDHFRRAAAGQRGDHVRSGS